MCKRGNAFSLPVLIARLSLIALIFNAHSNEWKDRVCGARSSGQARGLSARFAHACFKPSFAGLVVLAGSLYPIPSRTRPLNFPAPMVLSLKTWKSRSLPGLPRTEASSRFFLFFATPPRVHPRGGFLLPQAG